jgi:asparagine synthase (glutamine-hydrolysing)
VPAGINLSGGLDSSTLLGVVDALDDSTRSVTAMTFITGDERYDELPWVQQMLANRRHPLVISTLREADVPALAVKLQAAADQPIGGVPTLAYARLFEDARDRGITVLLDGQGMDEQWAGYSYYAAPAARRQASVVQGSRDAALRPDCLDPDFRALAEPPVFAEPFGDDLRNLQYRDLFVTKLPRALVYNDRASMRASTELREPFLDHRLVELAVRQPARRKICGGEHKTLLRRIARRWMDDTLVTAPKRPVQTPQREWLRGSLRNWTDDVLQTAFAAEPAWLDRAATAAAWSDYCATKSDSSFFVWQWVSLGLSRALRGTQCELA